MAKVFPQKLHRRSSSENSDIPMIKIQRLFEIKIETRSQYDLGNLFSFFCIQNAIGTSLSRPLKTLKTFDLEDF